MAKKLCAEGIRPDNLLPYGATACTVIVMDFCWKSADEFGVELAVTFSMSFRTSALRHQWNSDV